MRLIKPSTQTSASSSWLRGGRLPRERAAARSRGHTQFHRALTCMESPFRKASQSLNGSVHNTPGVKTTSVNASPVRPVLGLCSAVNGTPSGFCVQPLVAQMQHCLCQDVSDKKGQTPPRSASRYFSSLQRSMRRSLSRVFSLDAVQPVRLRALRISAADLTELVAKTPCALNRWQRAVAVRL